MKEVIFLGSKPVTLKFNDFSDEVDVDKLLSVDYSNLYGEAVTIPALLNQVGILKAQAERAYSEKKLEFEVFEAELRQRLRKEATETSQKMTEASLNELVSTDGGYKVKKKNVTTSKYNLDICDSIFWAVSAKNKKLDNLVKGVTPQELYDELIEGTINNILIKKNKPLQK